MGRVFSFDRKRLVNHAVAALTIAAFLSGSANAFAQGEPAGTPVAVEEDQPPPPPATDPIPPAYTQTDGRQPPPPGYGPPPPGYGPPADPYNYGVPPGTPYAGDIDDWEEGDPVPPGYQPSTRIRKGLVIGGAVTMGALWVISVLIGGIAVSVEDADDALGGDSNGITAEDWYPMFIPVAGPFITIITAEASGAGTAFLVIDGIGQVGGLAMLIAGLAAQESYLRRVPQYGEVNVEFAPVITPEFAGMGLKGSF